MALGNVIYSRSEGEVASWRSWGAAVSRLSRDSIMLGLPDRKLLYAGVAYIPIHAGALAYLLFAPRRPAPLDLDAELAKKER